MILSGPHTGKVWEPPSLIVVLLFWHLEEENSIDGLGRVDVLHDVFGDGGVG